MGRSDDIVGEEMKVVTSDCLVLKGWLKED